MSDLILTDSKNLILKDDYFIRWQNYIDAAPSTIDTYTKAIKQFSDYLKANKIKEPKREDVISYRNELLKKCKPTTVQNYLTAVKLFFKWTSQENLYPNVADHIKGTKIDKEHKKDYLTSKQVKMLLNSVDRGTIIGLRDYAILLLMVTTGLRTISIIEANVDDIRTIGDSSVLFYKGKGHSEKAIYVKLAEPVEQAIHEYLKARCSCSYVNADKTPLFASLSNRNSGNRLTTRSLRRMFKERLKNIGINNERLTAHSLRHTAATLNLLNGATILETQQLLDHSNINTTLIYSHALERINNKSEERIANIIFND